MLTEITSIDDAAWRGWLEIYEASLPVGERLPEGYFLHAIQRRATGCPSYVHVLAWPDRDDNGVTVGIANYEFYPAVRTAFLRYLAVREEARGRGCGAAIYQAVVRRAADDGAELVVFEVDPPDSAADAGDRDVAVRRIRWYARHGALALTGVRYTQSDPGLASIPLLLMAHPLVDLSTDEVYARLEQVFGAYLVREPGQGIALTEPAMA